MWSSTIRSQMNQLDLIASWASQVQLGRVRDLCRQASAELKHELERAIENEAAEAGGE